MGCNSAGLRTSIWIKEKARSLQSCFLSGVHLCHIGFPQEGGPGKPAVSPVDLPEANQEISIIFGRTCACRKYLDPRTPRACTPVTDVTGGG